MTKSKLYKAFHFIKTSTCRTALMICLKDFFPVFRTGLFNLLTGQIAATRLMHPTHTDQLTRGNFRITSLDRSYFQRYFGKANLFNVLIFFSSLLILITCTA